MKTYLVLLVDRIHASLFTLTEGMVEKKKKIKNGYVPQKVKHGDDTWDAQDKIFRHIEDHFHRHLKLVGQSAIKFIQGEKINGVIIGSHKPLFSKIEKHLPYPLSRMVKGKFVTELKAPFNEILKRAVQTIEKIEIQERGKVK